MLCFSLPPIGQSVYRMHRPTTSDDTIPTSPFARRLAFDEILASQMIMSLISDGSSLFNSDAASATPSDFSLNASGHLIDQLIKSLPFPLTDNQEQVSKEIISDLRRSARFVV